MQASILGAVEHDGAEIEQQGEEEVQQSEYEREDAGEEEQGHERHEGVSSLLLPYGEVYPRGRPRPPQCTMRAQPRMRHA